MFLLSFSSHHWVLLILSNLSYTRGIALGPWDLLFQKCIWFFYTVHGFFLNCYYFGFVRFVICPIFHNGPIYISISTYCSSFVNNNANIKLLIFPPVSRFLGVLRAALNTVCNFRVAKTVLYERVMCIFRESFMNGFCDFSDIQMQLVLNLWLILAYYEWFPKHSILRNLFIIGCPKCPRRYSPKCTFQKHFDSTAQCNFSFVV